MEYTQLGRTGIRVSVAGLGCGGHSRLGLFSRGLENASGIVRHAFDSGVTFFDTAYNYRTHPAVAKGLAGIPRDQYILSSKFPPQLEDGTLRTAAELEALLDESLKELQTDHLDIWHLHAVGGAEYPAIRDRFLPELERVKAKGKIRCIGITEMFATDTGQIDAELAEQDGLLDFLVEEGHAASIMEAAYRYCRHTKGLDVILTGTGNKDHLSDNLKSILMPALSAEVLFRLDALFGKVDCVSGQ